MFLVVSPTVMALSKGGGGGSLTVMAVQKGERGLKGLKLTDPLAFANRASQILRFNPP